jgi:phosphate/phosphite/phosphonate ABC transporter binding protein
VKRLKSRLIYIIAVFIALEVLAIIIAVWPVFFDKSKEVTPKLRLGIVSSLSKENSRKKWSGFFKYYNEDLGLPVKPYFANSTPEAVAGLENFSLDMLYINPAVFLLMNRTYGGFRPLLFHRMSLEQLQNNRSVLVTRRDIEFIEDSKGLKITFTERYSMAGYIVPDKYLKEKISPDYQDKWFSEVKFTEIPEKALEKLFNGETDVVAINYSDFLDILNLEEKYRKKLKVIWMSIQLPENMICVNDWTPYYDLRDLFIIRNKLSSQDIQREFELNNLTDILNHLIKEAKMNPNRDKKLMFFEPVGFSYEQRLEKLKEFLYHTKAENKK